MRLLKDIKVTAVLYRCHIRHNFLFQDQARCFIETILYRRRMRGGENVIPVGNKWDASPVRSYLEWQRKKRHTSRTWNKVQWMKCFKMKNIMSCISNKKHKGTINYSSLSFTSDPQGDCRETLLKNKPMMMIYATLPSSFYRSHLPSCSTLLEEFQMLKHCQKYSEHKISAGPLGLSYPVSKGSGNKAHLWVHRVISLFPKQ